jgi:hypothetical protein
MSKIEFMISKVAADLDSTNNEIQNNNDVMSLILSYLADEEQSYEQLLAKANIIKHTLRR